MKTMSALEAKNTFGQFLEAAQREPVAVTKNRRQVAAMFSMKDINSMAKAYLSEPVQRQIDCGEMSVLDALLRQAFINERIAYSQAEAAEGKTRVMDVGYFDDLRTHVQAVSKTRST